MDNSKTTNDSQPALTLEMLGLVKRSTLESQQKQKIEQQQTANCAVNNGIKDPPNNRTKIKPEIDVKSTNGNKQSDDDDDIKIINEKINVKQDKKEIQEEKIEIKLKPEEFILDDEEIGMLISLINY